MAEKYKQREENLISVIIPVYNKERYLSRCIESVLNQSYRKLEILLIDDGSEDKSGKICDDYGAEDERIRVLHQENRGVSAARNQGLSVCKGDYITFIDADDYVDENYCKELVCCMISREVKVAMCNAWICEPERNRRKVYYGNMPCDKQIPVNRDFNYAKNIYAQSVWGKLYRRDVLEGKRFREEIQMGEDCLFIASILKEVSFISYRASNLYYYCMNRESVTHQQYNEKWDSFLIAWKEIIKMYSEDRKSVAYTSANMYYLTSCRYQYGWICLSDINGKEDKKKELLDAVRKKIKFIWKADDTVLSKMKLFLFAGMPNVYGKLFKIKKGKPEKKG